jgi:hypothetical protein
LTDIITVEPRCWDTAHRSYSSDRDWDECQFKWHAKNVLKVPNPLPAKVAVGSAVDLLVKDRLLGIESDPEQVTARFFREYLTPDIDLPKAVETTVSLLTLWEREVREVWERIGIYAVEYELHFDVDGIPYHVHPDVVLKDGTIIDLKTGDQRLGQDRVMYDVQLTTYAEGLRAEFGHIAPNVILDGLINAQMPKDVSEARGIRDKDRPKPWWERQVSNRTAEQLDAWRASVVRREQARRFAESTGVYQTQGRSAQYACNGCPARSICPEWSGWEGMFESKEVSNGA